MASITTVVEMLRDCSLEHLQSSLAADTLADLDAKLDEGRPALLEHLKAAGIAKLGDRQALANAMGKAKRASRIVPAAEEQPAGAGAGAAVAALGPLPSSLAAPAVASDEAKRHLQVYGLEEKAEMAHERYLASRMLDAEAIDVSDTTAAAAAAGADPGPAYPLPPRATPGSKLRLLCLHAFRTNGDILKQQMAFSGQDAFMRDDVELTYLDAPYACTPEDDKKQYPIVFKIFPKEKFGDYREWFNANVDKGGTGPQYVTYARYEASIRLVVEALAAASPPFDGIMGFSQGGSLAMWIATLQARGKLGRVPPLRLLYVQSARLPRDHSCAPLYEPSLPKLQIPSFVTYTEDDHDVKPEETKALVGWLADPIVAMRDKGGHGLMSITRAPEEAQKLKAFLQAQK